MKANSGQIEPLEGVVQVSESLAKKPDIKIIVQVWTNCMLCSEFFWQVLLRLFSSFVTDERTRNWWDFSSAMRWSSPVGQFSPQLQSRPPPMRLLQQYQLSHAARSTENVYTASQCNIWNFGRIQFYFFAWLDYTSLFLEMWNTEDNLNIHIQDRESEEKPQECEKTEDMTERLGCYLTPFKIGFIINVLCCFVTCRHS